MNLGVKGSHKNDGSKGGEKLGEMGSEFFRVQRIESFSSYKVSVPIQAPDPHMIDSARILKSERPSHEERIREREEVSREMLPCEDWYHSQVVRSRRVSPQGLARLTASAAS